jgi:cytoskeletal protein CcmA (bactofilin family)
MFHRVKSEVQDTELKLQSSAGLSYRPAEERARSFGEREEEVSQARQEEETTNAYDTEKENNVEEQIMDEQEETTTQKYTRETETARVRAPEPQAYGYQRPGQAAPVSRPAAAYSGGSSYTPTTYTPPASSVIAESASSYSSSSDRTLTIGRGINMSGEIDACDHLVVEGTVEAALKGAKVLEIAESGTFYGTVEIEEATIAGRFEGDITVNGRLTIRASGAITGSIAYRELEVEAGAMLDGRMTPLKGIVDPKSADKYKAGSEASALAKAKEIVSKKDNREPANAEHALFSKARAR